MKYVKTYNLCTGVIEIGNILEIIDRNVNIDCWYGVNQFMYKDEQDYRTIKTNTMIWDERYKRYVFAYGENMLNGYACFSTIVVDISDYLEPLLIDNEKVIFHFDERYDEND